ncbi:MAG: phosphoribosylanthranilate isomerase [Candidatus Rokubacteria bacterium]|nr:phosphoribosylanthranilate isomerase [Candidatus Rokubacteria bacterium]
MVRVKICGITNLEDALLAAEAGADALGFIFVAGTPRYVEPARARAIIRELPPFICPVGVFWDHPPEVIREVAEACGLGALQLHGDEPPEATVGFRLPVIKAVKVAGPDDLAQLDRYKVEAFLLDSPARWSEGSPRPSIPWELARQAASRGRIVLSAGLTPDNVGEAIRIAAPYGVDVNSGVEAAPGRKDPAKVRRFIEVARRG